MQKLIDFLEIIFFLGWGQPSLVTGHWLIPMTSLPLPMHAYILRVHEHCEVIKLPLHCPSPFLQCQNETKEKKKNKVLQLLISGVGFLMFCFFLFLHTNMHHLILQELRKAANILGFGKKKTMVVLCSLLMFSLLPLLSLLLSHYFSNLSIFLRSPKLSPSHFYPYQLESGSKARPKSYAGRVKSDWR